MRTEAVRLFVRDVSWGNAPFAKLQTLPENGKAIASCKYKDSAWRNVSEGIEKVVAELHKKSR